MLISNKTMLSQCPQTSASTSTQSGSALEKVTLSYSQLLELLLEGLSSLFTKGQSSHSCALPTCRSSSSSSFFLERARGKQGTTRWRPTNHLGATLKRSYQPSNLSCLFRKSSLLWVSTKKRPWSPKISLQRQIYTIQYSLDASDA